MGRSMLAALAALGLLIVGCGSDGGGGDSGANNSAGSGSSVTAGSGSSNTAGSGQVMGVTGGSGSPSGASGGVTPCGDFPDGPKSCQAGQYCLDQTFSRCEAGCLSDTNCASNQTCQKETGATTGSCQNKPSATDCEAVCDRLLACEPGVTRPMCLQFCAGFNEPCKQCIVRSNCIEADACQDSCGI